MSDITYSITDIVEGFTWTGTIAGVDLNATLAASIPSSISATANGVPATVAPNATNGYKIYPSNDGNHYITFRSQNIATQYPNSGNSLDIWSAALYNDIVAGTGATWQLIGESNVGAGYPLNTSKYTLLYDYESPNAVMWCRGGKINFTIV